MVKEKKLYEKNSVHIRQQKRYETLWKVFIIPQKLPNGDMATAYVLAYGTLHRIKVTYGEHNKACRSVVVQHTFICASEVVPYHDVSGEACHGEKQITAAFADCNLPIIINGCSVHPLLYEYI